MDKRINLLNTLKKRLNNLIPNQNNKKNCKKTSLQNIEYSRLRAILLNEYIQSGMAFDEFTFNKVEAYSEFSDFGEFNFHIYPINTDLPESLERESKDQKVVKEHKQAIQLKIKE